MTAQLSYQDQKGYYGLLVEPSYDQMLRSLRKEIRIPQPDRSAKWYATGIYRAFLLEQAKRYNDAQRKDLEYDATGAQLPRAAENGQQESMAGTDDTWNRQEQFNSNLNAEEARRVADDALAAEQRMQANQMRRQPTRPAQGIGLSTRTARTSRTAASLTQSRRLRWPCLRVSGAPSQTNSSLQGNHRQQSSRPMSS